MTGKIVDPSNTCPPSVPTKSPYKGPNSHPMPKGVSRDEAVKTKKPVNK
jgi:hypothetical protein